MMIGINISASIASTVTSVADADAGKGFRLGTLGFYDDPTEGTKAFYYIEAGETITALGYVCAIRAGNIAEMIDSTSSATLIGARAGAAQAAMVAGEQGWLQVYGLGDCRLSTLAALGTGLASTTTPGELDDAMTTGLEPVWGIYNGETIGGADATSALAQFNFPVVGNTIL